MKQQKKYRMKFIMLIMFIFPLAVSAKTYGEIKELSISSEIISSMEIECGAGFLKVKGVEGLDEIKVKADITAGNKKGEKLNKFIEEEVELSLEKHGGRAVLVSRIKPPGFSIFFKKHRNIRIDLTVEVPKEMNIELKDGSGDIELKNINGEIDIDDGSGSIEVADVTGELDIDDGSGDLKINSIEGKTEIHDGSGELDIQNVIGEMEISDGSGNLEVTGVTGDLSITDGSGDIKIDKVKGDIDIADGSGSLWTTDIDGNVKIHDGSGSIYIDGVSRDVDIAESGSGGVQFKNVKGNVSGDL